MCIVHDAQSFIFFKSLSLYLGQKEEYWGIATPPCFD